MKLLLHACCGPCSLEPLRLLQEDGHEIAIAYMNSNIHPRQEYDHRLETMLDWARDQGIEVIEGPYDPQAWARCAGVLGTDPDKREMRCRACYRLRLEEAAAWAAEHGFEGISTTLTVSPYQYVDVIEEELTRVAAAHGLVPVFRDFRPRYPEATRRSKELGMYRQNYCGCTFSKIEAAEEREARAAQRAAERARHLEETAAERAEAERVRAQNRARKQAYADKRAAQKAALKEFKRREKALSQEED